MKLRSTSGATLWSKANQPGWNVYFSVASPVKSTDRGLRLHRVRTNLQLISAAPELVDPGPQEKLPYWGMLGRLYSVVWVHELVVPRSSWVPDGAMNQPEANRCQ